VPNPPVVESISEDPLLADTKIIAEAWDAAGAYQVGSFARQRWAEWNGRFRDDVRRFWRGDPHQAGNLATRLAGSSDLYEPSGRSPYHSINFVTSHDGFTLNDLVSYNDKHNEANGEGNRDGENANYAFNHGVEGPTWRREVERTRLRQIKNHVATLLLSQGVPMLLSGNECRRTQRGNNNAWCQDNDLSWFDWRLARKHRGLRRFCQALIAFRRAEPSLRRRRFFTGKAVEPGGLLDVSWYGADGGEMDWAADQRSLVCLLAAQPPQYEDSPRGHHVLMMFHAATEACRFTVPSPARHLDWRQFINTAIRSPRDIYPALDGPAMAADGVTTLEPRSLVCWIAAATP
jgi:isoamylase